jgi:integrase/recombinase XerD
MATDLREANVALEVVQELIGHASLLSTQVYLHPSPARLREAVEHAGAFRQHVREAIEREERDGAR